MNKVERRREWKKRLVEYKGGKCSACLTSNLPQYVYEFHHIVQGISISDILRKRKFNFPEEDGGVDWEVLKQELNKTVLLCTNCHKSAHYEEHHV